MSYCTSSDPHLQTFNFHWWTSDPHCKREMLTGFKKWTSTLKECQSALMHWGKSIEQYDMIMNQCHSDSINEGRRSNLEGRSRVIKDRIATISQDCQAIRIGNAAMKVGSVASLKERTYCCLKHHCIVQVPSTKYQVLFLILLLPALGLSKVWDITLSHFPNASNQYWDDMHWNF